MILTESGFIRAHHSYLVNLLHIKQYIKGEGALILSNNKEIAVSRRKKENIITGMKEFYKF